MVWNEYLWQKDLGEVKQKRMIHASGMIWMKIRSDKNCLSNKPTDCMVWCLVEIPRKEYMVEDLENSSHYILRMKFKESTDGDFFWKERSVANSAARKYKVIDFLDGSELHLIDFKVKPCE